MRFLRCALFLLICCLTTTTLQAQVSTTTTNTTVSSIAYGQTITLTATVTSSLGAPTGTVTFTNADGSVTYGTAPLPSLSGNASTVISQLLVDSYDIIAVYTSSQPTVYQDSDSSPAQTLTITKADTSATITSSPPPSAVVGQTYAISATISPNPSLTSSGAVLPTGTASLFLNGSTTPVDTKPITQASGNVTFSLQTLVLGTSTFTVQYNGDGNYNLSPISATQTVTANKASTSIALTSSLNPSVVGQPITLTATVTVNPPGSATPPLNGSVEFFDGSTSLGSSILSGSQATLPTSFFTVGDHTLTAVYSGDLNFTTSTSSPITQMVFQSFVQTTTTLASTPNPSFVGQVVTLTATVSSANSGTPSGTVQFFDGNTSLGSGPLSGGVATLAVSNFGVGIHPLQASYSGNGNFDPSASPTMMQTVVPLTGNDPVVTNVTPSGAPPGTSITINGTSFTGVTGVNFGDIPAASFHVNSATSITAIVPAGFGQGSITVTTLFGTSISSPASQFVIQPAAPLLPPRI